MATVITTLTGLQNLPNLGILRADYNGLHNTTVDVSGLTNLTDLDLSDNDDITNGNDAKLTVNVTGCTALDDLRLDDNDLSENQLGSIIGLSGLTALTHLDLDDCGLSGTINLSILPSLDYIDLSLNANLNAVIISNSQPIVDFDARNCALTQTSADNILVALSTNGQINGNCELDGENNFPPSATGTAAKGVLEGNGWFVAVSSPL